MASTEESAPRGLERLLGFFVDNGVVVTLLTMLLVGAGLYTAPFAVDLGIARDPVPVDAIPDVGENQQVVFTEWPGRSPRDVEDQVTYPLTTALLGIPGVRTVRSTSMLGFCTIYVIFEDDVEFYWSRSRVLEKLASLPAGMLPDDASPTLGPDATALGQVFWYTLEGQGSDGEVVGGWDLHELRSIQDWTVRYALASVPGVSEVASVGGHVREYQIDVDPDALRAHGVTLAQVARAVRGSNLDAGARTLEVNNVEYLVRGLGFLEDTSEIEETVVITRDGAPLRVRDVAHVGLGPAQRRGALDDAGAEAVGGVVVVRFGENPLEVIERVKAKLAELAPGLPRRVLEDGTEAQVKVVPFYDRTTLIHETLDTLSTALWQQILVTILVVLVMLGRLRASALVSLVLPLGVLGAFVAMKVTGVDANIMALAGIAIAIGTMVDMGIVLVDNISQRLDEAPEGEERRVTVRRAAAEVAPAIFTSVATTVVSFLPVFGLTASEGKLFSPLAWTKTFAMLAAVLIAALVLPLIARLILRRRSKAPDPVWGKVLVVVRWALAGVVLALLAHDWLPLGPENGFLPSLVFVAALVGAVLGLFSLFAHFYPMLLRTFLANKAAFLVVPFMLTLAGFTAWAGFDSVFGWLPSGVRTSAPVSRIAHAFPGFGREYMPPFDEGSFLYMPSTMPHASIGASLDAMHRMDAAIAQIPEVDRVVGKLGRAESALDPAPVSMYETVISYVPEYGVDDAGERVRNWRPHIQNPNDIWEEIVAVAQAPGLTSAPVLQPISTRIVMLQSGMRAPMGLKVRGPDLETLEAFGRELEILLREVPGIRSETVFAERLVGKPYLEIDFDREAIARHGLSIADVQRVVSVGLGGQVLTRTVEGRERYPVRVRFAREERDSVEALAALPVSTSAGITVPLSQLAEFRYRRGPQSIRSEDTFLTSFVLFDREQGQAEVDVVEQAQRLLASKIDSGELLVPAGVSFRFAGSYENQVRSEERLLLLLPVAFLLVLLILQLQFRSLVTTFIIYSGVAVAVGGGFLLLWAYGRPGFLDVSLLGMNMQDLFQVGPINMSVAVWIGFVALLGIATDDGVVMATYLRQSFEDDPPETVEAIRERTLQAGLRRVRPCLMTTATTLLALLPVITSQGRGADVMMPMALPALGGMTVALVTLFVVPVLYSLHHELRLWVSRLLRARQPQVSEP